MLSSALELPAGFQPQPLPGPGPGEGRLLCTLPTVFRVIRPFCDEVTGFPRAGVTRYYYY
jgi:hypothetical protein